MQSDTIAVAEDVDSGSPISDCIPDHLTEEKLVEEVWGRVDASYQESHHERVVEWPQNWMFTFPKDGDQWMWFNEEAEEYAPLPVPPERRFTENHLIGAVRHASAALSQKPPAFDTAPLKRSIESRRAARFGKQLLFHYKSRLKLGQTAKLTAAYTLICGMGIEKTYWNVGDGEVDFAYKPEDEPPDFSDEDGEDPYVEAEILRKRPRKYERKPERIGAMCVENVDPRNFFPQPYLTKPTLRGAHYATEASFHSKAELRRIFNLPDDYQFDEDYGAQYRFANFGFPNPTFGNEYGSIRDGRVLVLTYYQLPAAVPGWEKGAVISVCGRKMLGKPYRLQAWQKGGILPFQLYPWQSRPGKFWPRPWVSDLIEPQMRINQALSHTLTWTGLLCGPNLLVQKNSGIPKQVPVGFAQLHYNMGSLPPSWLPPPQAPPELFQIKQMAQEAFQRVGLQFSPSMGQHQAGMPSGYYLRLLEEAGSIDKEPIVQYHAESREDQGKLLLRLAKDYEHEQGMVSIVGNGRRSLVTSFKRDQLEPDLFQVSVQPTSMMGFLAANRSQQALEMYREGFFGPPGQLPKKVQARLMEWMNLPDLFEIDDEFTAERAAAETNHDLLIYEGWTCNPPPQPQQPQMGQPPQPPQPDPKPKPGENRVWVDPRWEPSFFLEEARLRLLDDDVREWTPDIQANFDNYFNGLQAALQAQQEQMQAAEDAKVSKALDAEQRRSNDMEQSKAKGKIAEEAGVALIGLAQGGGAAASGESPKQVNPNLVIPKRGSTVVSKGGSEPQGEQ